MGVAGLFAWLELRRLLAKPAADAVGVAGIAGLAAACVLFAMVGVAAAAAAVAAAALVVAGVERGRLRARAAGLAGAGIILFLVVATLALRGDDPAGRATIFWLFAVVWASDTCAYAAGRAFGGPRLAPRISPAKTWAGALGGMVAAVGASILLGWLMPLAGWVAERPSFALLAAAGVLGSVVGQMGDLAESAPQAARRCRGLGPSHPRSRRHSGPRRRLRRGCVRVDPGNRDQRGAAALVLLSLTAPRGSPPVPDADSERNRRGEKQEDGQSPASQPGHWRPCFERRRQRRVEDAGFA